MTSSRPTTTVLPDDAWPAVGSAVLAVLLFAVTLRGTYVYDDLSIVRDDARVRSPARWGQLWTQQYGPDGIDNLYRPLVSTSYALEWWLHGDRPWAFHAVNVLLHAAAAAAVAEVARRATGRSAAGWAAGLVFAAHPIHTEAVANIVGRAELAAAVPLLASLAVLARRPLTPARAAVVVGCGVVALFSKEQGLLAPALWTGFVLLVWPNGPTDDERPIVRIAALISVWLWAGYLVVREHFLKFDWDRSLLVRAAQPMVDTTGVQRVLLPVALLGRYVALIVWPAHLSPDYGGDVIGSATRPADPYLWIGVAAAFAWTAATVVAWRRRSGFVLFCLLSLAVSYALVGNVVTVIGTIFGERLVYLPSAFLAMPVGVAAARLGRPVRVAALAVMLVPMSIATVRAAAEWNRSLTLFTRALRDHPASIQLHLLIAQTDHDEGREADRARVLDEACRRFPDYWRCWSMRAEAAADVGDFATADHALQQGMDRAFNPALLEAQGYVRSREEAAARRPTATRATGGR